MWWNRRGSCKTLEQLEAVSKNQPLAECQMEVSRSDEVSHRTIIINNL